MLLIWGKEKHLKLWRLENRGSKVLRDFFPPSPFQIYWGLSLFPVAVSVSHTGCSHFQYRERIRRSIELCSARFRDSKVTC